MTDQRPLPDQGSVVVARPIARAAAPYRALEMPYVDRREALLDLTLVLLASIVVPYVPSILTTIGPADTAIPDIGPVVILQKWCEAALVAGLLLYFVLRHRMRPAAFGLRADRLGSQATWGLATLIGMYGAFFIVSFLVLAVLAMTSRLEGEYHRRLEFAEALPVESLVSTLTLLVAVAIHEEILFRGLLLPYLRRLLGSWWWAGLASALLFAALHVPGQGLLAGVQVFSIAVVLAVFFILSRSLLAVTAAHLLFDFFQFQMIRLLPKLEQLLQGVEG
jgi:membrane protease YdiL (CAAX protease family)